MSSLPLVAIVGKSGSGKTTLLEKLLKILTARGWRVATIKHDAHSFDVDHPGKDSWRHREAGAAAVAITSASRLFVTVNLAEPLTLEQLRDTWIAPAGVDLVIAEGFKQSGAEKIEVHRTQRSDALICTREADRLIAVASDRGWEVGVPCFHVDDAQGIAAFIEARYLKERT